MNNHCHQKNIIDTSVRFTKEKPNVAIMTENPNDQEMDES